MPGERYDGQVIAASYYNLRDDYPCVDPLEIHVPMVRKYSEHLMLEWALGYDLMTRRPTLAPLNCVVSPYSPDGGVALFYSSTNGLASGNTRVDAVCHALCEMIERDATSLAVARSEVKPAVASLLADIGIDSGQLPTEAEEAAADFVARIAAYRRGAGPKTAARRPRGGTARPDLRRRHRRPSPAPSPTRRARPAA